MRARRAITLILVAGLGAGATYRFWPMTPLPENTKADRLELDKGVRRLVLYSGGHKVKSYRVSLGRTPRGAKEREGDGRTPEGHYLIDYRKADSDFHRALHVSYPDANDRRRAREIGVSPGGAIMIHGLPNGLGWIGRFHRFVDWTNGCVAVTDEEMDELWRAVAAGTPIEIRS